MNRFFIDRGDLSTNKMTAHIKNEADIHHISKSLRLSVGDKIEVSADLDESYIAEIVSIAKCHLELKLLEKLENSEMSLEVDLYQGIAKGHRWDFVLQKAVECGVHNIYPIKMQRCVSIIREGQEQKKQRRWQKIASEAAQQSKRSYITQVFEPCTIDDVLVNLKDYDLVLAAYLGEDTVSLKSFEMTIAKSKRIAIWIGPEGGFDETEIAKLAPYSKTITMGKRVFRTETAPLVLLSQIAYIADLEK